MYIVSYSMLACLVAQSCLTLCISINCSPPDSSVHRILQARVLEWGTIAFSSQSFFYLFTGSNLFNQAESAEVLKSQSLFEF